MHKTIHKYIADNTNTKKSLEDAPQSNLRDDELVKPGQDCLQNGIICHQTCAESFAKQ
jgi:hypothetical protein